MSQPKILFFDIETTPLVAYTWGPKWQTNLIEVLAHTRILSFSAKWLGGSHITRGWPNYKGYKAGAMNDKAIVADIRSFFNQADAVVAHNGRDFDDKVVNARVIAHGLTPPSPYRVIDTKIEAKKYVRLPSHSLDDLCSYFGIPRKMGHGGFSCWTRCMKGDPSAWREMLRYNKRDVTILEQLYLKIRPWMVSHPNMAMDRPGDTCPKCGAGGPGVLKWEGWYRNKTTKYHAFSCTECGGWGRDTKNVQEIKPRVGV